MSVGIGNRPPGYVPVIPEPGLEDLEGRCLVAVVDYGRPLALALFPSRLRVSTKRLPRIERALLRLEGVALVRRSSDAGVGVTAWVATPSGKAAVEERRRGLAWPLAVPAGRIIAERAAE